MLKLHESSTWSRSRPIAAMAMCGLACAAVIIAPLLSQAQLTGVTGAHDPSSLLKDGSTYYYFATGHGIVTRSSTNKSSWSAGPSVFNTPPAWTTQAVPGFTGDFWAPDIAYFNGAYHLYYSVSTWGSIDSAIGVATSPSLSSPTWTDQGKVVQSDAVGFTQPETDTTAYNTIDPSILVDNDTGRVWMSFGSYSSGIVVTELNPTTGKRLNISTLAATKVANNASGGGWGSTLEGSALIKHGSYYYLMVNTGGCCSGVDSTYEMRVGRSTSPTGPFLDKNGVDMRNGGGTLFLDDDGKMIGPGHFSLFSEADQDYFGYHYYNGDANGAPTYGLRNLYWTADAWPSYAAVNPDWAGMSGTNWSTSANWSGGTVPNGVGNVANFAANSFNRYSVSLDGSGKTVSTVNFRSSASYTIGTTSGNTLTIDAASGDAATINVSAGNHTIAAPITAVDSLGINVTPSGSILSLSGAVTAPMLTKYGYGTLSLAGANTYSGSVFAKWGKIDVTGSVSAAQFSSVGQILNENATMIVRGTGSFSANSDLNIGDTGDANTPATGTLELRDNASVTVNSSGGIFVGSGFSANTKAVGTVNQTGGTLTANGNFDGAFVIGGRGSSLPVGTYNLSGGTVNANTNLQIGGRGTGTLNQSGGSFNVNGYASVGRYSGAIGVWNVSGGALDQSQATRNLIVGESGNGTLTLSSSAQVTAAGTMRLGLNLGSVGAIHLNGGTLTTPAISRGNGSGTVNFDSGTLRAAATTTTFLQGLTNAYVKSGGANIDTHGFDIAIAQPLLHDTNLGATLDGGLNKLGVGTLTLAGNNTYTGPTTISLGKLVVNGSIGTGPATVSSFTTLAGTGTIAGLVNVKNGAHIAPGNSNIESLDVGSLTLASGSILDFELNTASSVSPSDLIRVTNTDGLLINGGTLNLVSTGTILPGTFTLVDYAGTLNGSFNSLSFGSVPTGFNYLLVNNASATSIDLVVSMLGDFNNDGSVDAADYVIWRKAPSSYGGASGYDAWRQNFGAISTGSGSTLTENAAPEPHGYLMILFGIGTALRSPRARQTRRRSPLSTTRR